MRIPGLTVDRLSPAELSAFVDSELGFWRSRRVRAHLATCEPCRRYVEQLERTQTIMRSLEPPRMTEELRGALRATYASWVKRPQELR